MLYPSLCCGRRADPLVAAHRWDAGKDVDSADVEDFLHEVGASAPLPPGTGFNALPLPRIAVHRGRIQHGRGGRQLRRGAPGTPTASGSQAAPPVTPPAQVAKLITRMYDECRRGDLAEVNRFLAAKEETTAKFLVRAPPQRGPTQHGRGPCPSRLVAARPLTAPCRHVLSHSPSLAALLRRACLRRARHRRRRHPPRLPTLLGRRRRRPSSSRAPPRRLRRAMSRTRTAGSRRPQRRGGAGRRSRDRSSSRRQGAQGTQGMRELARAPRASSVVGGRDRGGGVRQVGAPLWRPGGL